MNGNATLEENICDFASFQTAYSIFRSLVEEDSVEELLPLPGLGAYSTEQVFFIRYAQLWCEVATREGHLKSLQDNHSPGRFRANGGKRGREVLKLNIFPKKPSTSSAHEQPLLLEGVQLLVDRPDEPARKV